MINISNKKRIYDQKQNNRKSVKGSFTVEASFIMPILLFLAVGSINLGYHFFQEAKVACKIHEELKKLDPVSIVRDLTFVKEQIS